MIDLQLLKKISADDQAFIKSMVNKINDRSRAFSVTFSDSMQKGNWSSCYYQMLDFYRNITPYGQMSFLNEFKKYLDILSHSDDVQVKRGICAAVVNRINEHLGIASPKPEFIATPTQAQRSSQARL